MNPHPTLLRRGLLLAGLLIALLVLALGVNAQEDETSEACPLLVQTAVATARDLCDGANLNEACYGNTNLEAVPFDETGGLTFAAPGDVAALNTIRSLRLDGLDVDAGVWGIALMLVQAPAPQTGTVEEVTVALFGDVQIENRAPNITRVPGTIQGGDLGANVRLLPSLEAAVVNSLATGTVVDIIGRSFDGTWFQVQVNNAGGGWVAAELVQVDGDAASITVIEESAFRAPRSAMQAFTFRSAADDRPCSEAPESAIMIQTPEGVGEISLLINEVDIRLGSTAYLTARPDATGQPQLTVVILEGEARVEADGVAQYVDAGQRLFVPLDETYQATEQPTDPEPYDASADGLPLLLFTDPPEVPPEFEPNPSAPVITGIESVASGPRSFADDIFFSDREGDVIALNMRLLESSNRFLNFRLEGAAITIPAAQQQRGAIILRETECTPGTEGASALLEVTLTDASGLRSNIVEYRVRCGE